MVLTTAFLGASVQMSRFYGPAYSYGFEWLFIALIIRALKIVVDICTAHFLFAFATVAAETICG